jgi:uncharacterized membrane protein
MKKRKPFARWRANFFTGLAIVLPAVVSVAVVVWLFGTVANITDTLLIFLPKEWTHKDHGAGSMHWYWSLCALLLAILLIGLVGGLARYYFGKKLIELVDLGLLRVPLLNKIYSAIKQVNEAFSPSNKSSFKHVVLVEFPRAGSYSVGFVTGEDHQEVQHKTSEHVLSVFVPTTPNPTGGFLLLVPETGITKLDMSVAEGIKYIISLGAIAPEFSPAKSAR